jgi:hypothetical protein
MALKLYDWECLTCGAVREAFIDVPTGDDPPKWGAHYCHVCDAEQDFLRLVSAPAEYLAEKIRAPQISGGTYDTTGHRKPPKLPPPPEGVYRRQEWTEGGERCRKDVVDGEGLIDHLHSPECREIQRERKVIQRENQLKQARSPELAKGMRADEVFTKRVRRHV